MKFVVIISTALLLLTVPSVHGQKITTYYDIDSTLIKETYTVNNLEDFQLEGEYNSFYNSSYNYYCCG